jgi:2,3-bisphosphoglycerate-independent phosphoglycerate mutase
VIYQDFTRIDRAIETGEFATNPVLVEAVATARRNGSTLHVLGLLSPGGVHSHDRHIAAMVRMAAAGGAPRVRVHAFLDGRDTPPRSASASLAAMADVCATSPVCTIADIVGRYYAMDRDHRWDRVQAAYELIVDGAADYGAPDAQTALAAAYARGENDEFVKPTIIGAPIPMHDGDVVVFMNFRGSRARDHQRADRPRLPPALYASVPRLPPSYA